MKYLPYILVSIVVALITAMFMAPPIRSQTGIVVSTCPSVAATPYQIGAPVQLTVDQNGNLCVVSGVGVGASTAALQTAGNNLLTQIAGQTIPASTMAPPYVPTASDNHNTIKNGAGQVFMAHTSNNSAVKNYLRLYDSGAGFNGCNSTTNLFFAMEIPPNDGGFTVLIGGIAGAGFSNGLSFCITSGFGLTDTTPATPTAILFNAAYH